MKRSWLARHPIGFMALYSIFYLSVFHYLEANVPLRSILVHCRLDDLIPFCKYAVIPLLCMVFVDPLHPVLSAVEGPAGGLLAAVPAVVLRHDHCTGVLRGAAHGAGPAPLLGAGQRYLCADCALFVPHRHRHQRLPVHSCVQLGDAAAGVLPQPHFLMRPTAAGCVPQPPCCAFPSSAPPCCSSSTAALTWPWVRCWHWRWTAPLPPLERSQLPQVRRA